MWIDEASALAASAGAVRPVLLLRIDGDPIARAWSGVGELPIGQDLVETEADAIYRGVGTIVDWPPLEVLLNGEAGRLTFVLSGLDATVQDLFERELSALEGSRCDLGLAFLDDRWQLIADPLWMLQPEFEDADFSQERTEQGIVRTVSIGLAHGSLDRRRPLLAHWSPQDQTARSPTDRFCERTPIYNQDHTIAWPRFGATTT